MSSGWAYLDLKDTARIMNARKFRSPGNSRDRVLLEIAAQLRSMNYLLDQQGKK